MKRILALMLAAVMLLSLAACGDKNEKAKKETDGGQIETTAPETDITKKESNKTGEFTYDFSSPEEDLENAPGYQYFIQEIQTEETDITKLLTEETTYEAITAEIQKITGFEDVEPAQEPLNNEVQVTDSEGNILETQTNNDLIIYAQTPDLKHEIDVAVYTSNGYHYLTYGTMQPITAFENWESELDISNIPEIMKNVTGMTLTEKDIAKMLSNIEGLKTQTPDNQIYMVSITDPETYSAIQVTLLNNGEGPTIGIIGSRYIELAGFEDNTPEVEGVPEPENAKEPEDIAE